MKKSVALLDFLKIMFRRLLCLKFQSSKGNNSKSIKPRVMVHALYTLPNAC